MNLAQALSAGRWTMTSPTHDASDGAVVEVHPQLARLAVLAPTIRTRTPAIRKSSVPTPRYKNGRQSPVRDALLAALKDGALTRGEIVRRMSGMDSVAVDVLLCRLVQKGVILRTKEPGCRAFYALAGEPA